MIQHQQIKYQTFIVTSPIFNKLEKNHQNESQYLQTQNTYSFLKYNQQLPQFEILSIEYLIQKSVFHNIQIGHMISTQHPPLRLSVPKMRRPTSSTPKFQYFGDDSDISRLSNAKFKKSANILGTRFLDSNTNFSNISMVSSGYSHIKKKEQTYSSALATLQQPNRKRQEQPQKNSRLFRQQTSVSKGQIQKLTGRIEYLEGLVESLAVGEAKTQSEISSLRRCVSASEKEFGTHLTCSPHLTYSPLSFMSPSRSKLSSENSYLEEEKSTGFSHRIQHQNRPKQTVATECSCGGFAEKQQMQQVVFQLYQENRYFENQIAKRGQLKKSSVLQGKRRMEDLFERLRRV